jgi:hypothetical protein
VIDTFIFGGVGVGAGWGCSQKRVMLSYAYAHAHYGRSVQSSLAPLRIP